jgi:hypothetical protein
MRFVTLVRLFALAAALALPAAASAQFELTINPERLDGEGFLFEDDEQGDNNQLEFDVDGPSITARGTVRANSGSDIVTITYSLGFPNSASATDQQATVSQRNQVLVAVNVDFAAGEDYFGQAAPQNCRASAKIRDTETNDPDDPDNSGASLTCDLGPSLQLLDDDDDAMTPGDPPQAALNVITGAFSARKDVRVQVNNGKIVIKHKGSGVEN